MVVVGVSKLCWTICKPGLGFFPPQSTDYKKLPIRLKICVEEEETMQQDSTSKEPEPVYHSQVMTGCCPGGSRRNAQATWSLDVSGQSFQSLPGPSRKSGCISQRRNNYLQKNVKVYPKTLEVWHSPPGACKRLHTESLLAIDTLEYHGRCQATRHNWRRSLHWSLNFHKPSLALVPTPHQNPHWLLSK